MLVEHHAVEAELVRVGELVDVLLVEAATLLRVPQLVRHRDPAAIVFFIEVRRQMWIGHEVPAVECDGCGHARLTRPSECWGEVTAPAPYRSAPVWPAR